VGKVKLRSVQHIRVVLR